jgi:hypothetical protein
MQQFLDKTFGLRLGQLSAHIQALFGHGNPKLSCPHLPE